MEILTIKKKATYLTMDRKPELFGEKFENLLEIFEIYIMSNFKMFFAPFKNEDIVKVKIYEENKIIKAQIDIKTEYFRKDISNIASIIVEMIEVIEDVINL